MKKRGPKAYSAEFREEALRLIEAGSRPLAQVARELGVHLLAGTIRPLIG
jgi:transposase-like protein